MKKIFTILVLAMVSVMSWATVNITVNPNVIDFGTINLNAEGEAEANATATLTWSGLTAYCGVFVDTIGAPASDADYEFWATTNDGSDFWYGGDEWNEPDDPTVYVGVYAVAPGDYEIKYVFYSYATEDDWYAETNKAGNAELTVRAKVRALGTDIESVQNSEVSVRKMLRNGQVMIRRNGETYFITGERVND